MDEWYGWQFDFGSAVNFQDGNPHEFFLTFSGGNWKLFNGTSLVGEGIQNANFPVACGAAWIGECVSEHGQREDFGWSGFTGTLEAVAVYDRVLTSGEMGALIASGCASGPLIVYLTEPQAGARFTAGSPITVTANAVANPGNVTKVEFFAAKTGGAIAKIGEATKAPWSIVWANPEIGGYSLSATALNDAGTMVTSSAVNISVRAKTSQLVTTVTETFDTGLGHFDLQVRNKENGTDFGFANSNTAGGTAGELGGTLVRTSTAEAAYVGDGTLGGLLTPASQKLVLKGKLKIVPDLMDGTMFIGYVNTNSLTTRLGILIDEPGGGFEPNYRARLSAPGGSGSTFGLEPNVVQNFDLVWDPDAKKLGGTIGSHVVEVTANPGDAEFDAVVVGAMFAADSNPNLANQVFLDNFTYTVIGVPTITETFDTGLGTFDSAKNNTANGNNFGFSSTANAGGNPGEAGGVLARTTTADAAYIGDVTLGGRLSLALPLILRGRFFLQADTADGDMFIGYADTAKLGNRLGLLIAEPGGGVEPNFRVFISANGKTSETFPVAPGKAWGFDLAWDPNAGRMQGTIAGQAVDFAAGTGTTEFDSFLVGAYGASSTDPAAHGKLFLDDVTYNFVSEAPPLSVKITQPGAGANLASGQDIVVTAEASTQRGSIQRVEFFAKAGTAGAAKIGEATTSPFTVTWKNAAPGDYVLTAKVTNDSGQSATSSEIAIKLVSALAVAQRTETFDTGIGAFKTAVKNHEGGNDFGFSNTANAGGKAGEAGGTFARTTSANAAYIADTNLGGRLVPAFQDLVLKGKLHLKDVSFDGNLWLGYVDTANLGTFMGVLINEPGGGVEPNFRGSAVMPGAGSPIIPLAPATVHEFDLVWKAGTKTFTGTFAGQTVNLTADPGNVSFDAVVIGAFGAGSSDATLQGQFYVDDLTYSYATAPPPSLAIAKSGANLVISWTGEGFKLQFRDGFGAATVWADSTEPVTPQGGGSSATVALSGNARFWRLVK